ncbi:MAG: hypothetical protein JEZ11_17720 [Desulfobacterales bacterium]|nr:hypothetical protein [Desulfobacterales bacterium]
MNLENVALRVRYIGSPEHKNAPSFAGRLRPRADATICDSELNDRQGELTAWLQEAIRAGQVGGPWEGVFPRYAWYRQEDVVYEARLVNRELGDYKGYALEKDEWPKGIAP